MKGSKLKYKNSRSPRSQLLHLACLFLSFARKVPVSVLLKSSWWSENLPLPAWPSSGLIWCCSRRTRPGTNIHTQTLSHTHAYLRPLTPHRPPGECWQCAPRFSSVKSAVDGSSESILLNSFNDPYSTWEDTVKW